MTFQDWLLNYVGNGIATSAKEIAEAAWDAGRLDVQSKHQILTCIYCGHEYPPNTPASNHATLNDHIRVCEKHPMKTAIDLLKRSLLYTKGGPAETVGFLRADIENFMRSK